MLWQCIKGKKVLFSGSTLLQEYKNYRIEKKMFCWLCDIQNQLALMRKDSQK